MQCSAYQKEKEKYVGLWCLHSYENSWSQVYKNIEQKRKGRSLIFHFSFLEKEVEFPAQLLPLGKEDYKIDTRKGSVDSSFDFFAFAIEVPKLWITILEKNKYKVFEIEPEDAFEGEDMYTYLNQDKIFTGWVYSIVSNEKKGILVGFYDKPHSDTLYTSGAPIFSLRGEKFLGIVSAGDQVYLESEDGKKRIYQYLTACNSKFIYEHLKGQNI